MLQDDAKLTSDNKQSPSGLHTVNALLPGAEPQTTTKRGTNTNMLPAATCRMGTLTNMKRLVAELDQTWQINFLLAIHSLVAIGSYDLSRSCLEQTVASDCGPINGYGP